MEEMQQNDISDPTYLKKRGTQMLKAYIISINDLENEALHLIHQPLQIKWRYAYILNQNKVADLLRGCSHFTRLYQSPDRSSFIWGRFNEERDYQWGYLLLEHNCLFLVVPPGKDIEILGRDIRKSLIGVDLIVSLQHFEPSLKYARQMERKMVIDLGEFFERNPETLVKFLRQDSLPDEDSEWMQGVFLLKLGTLLKNYLEEKHPHK
ncbi:MAG: hypothetical protein U9N81_07560, partial [Bacillota bacterium]|nr:hypothetical protein [Bacillota bacterium]